MLMTSQVCGKTTAPDKCLALKITAIWPEKSKADIWPNAATK